MNLDELREKIDALDAQILALLNERAAHAKQIGDIKRSNNAAFYVPEREKAILEELLKKNPGPLPDRSIKAIYREIISAVRALEKPISVAYLGPSETFSHKAALCVFGASAEFHPVASLPDIFTEVERQRIDYGVVPVESSMGGSVSDTLDRFLASDLKIVNEVMLRITQNLLAKGPLERIERVYSKDNVFIQCRNWLKANLPNVELVATSSTAEAARIAAQEEGAAAIASDLAAESYNLGVQVEGIEDARHNYTRFFVIGRHMARPTGNDKTSVLMLIRDRPGALYQLLQPFSDAGINLTRIESRPSQRKAWEYVFFVDLEGHAEEPAIHAVLDKVAEDCLELKVLGSYPKGNVEE